MTKLALLAHRMPEGLRYSGYQSRREKAPVQVAVSQAAPVSYFQVERFRTQLYAFCCGLLHQL
jgi:hypothetical protein